MPGLDMVSYMEQSPGPLLPGTVTSSPRLPGLGASPRNSCQVQGLGETREQPMLLLSLPRPEVDGKKAEYGWA